MRACGIVLGICAAAARPDLVNAEEVSTRWGLGREFGDELRGISENEEKTEKEKKKRKRIYTYP